MQTSPTQLFEVILDEDERIIKVFKPHKGKLFLSSLLIFILATFWILAFLIPMNLFPEDITPTGLIILNICVIGGWVLALVLTLLLVSLYYGNRFCAYSNKRIIIRTGIFGVDFKSLDMAMIGAVNVYVSPIDKIYNKDTGTITFGSMASPMVSAGGNSVNPYRFTHITAPYAAYKEIKAVIDEYKKTKNS